MTSSELFGSYLKKATPTPGGGDFGDDEPGSSFLFFQKPKVNITDARADRNAWQQASEVNTISAYNQYLRQYPTGEFRLLAEKRRTQLEKEEQELIDWQNASKQNTTIAYRTFIQKHPKSPYRDLAEFRMEDLQATPEPPKSRLPSNIDDLVFVQGGTFQMGSADSDAEDNEKPV
ncbi:MAG: hypothetical protein AAF806_32595, partial [Bacteroidota bacterium]